MTQLTSVTLPEDDRRAILASMVDEIGSSPRQDLHFDYWHYEGQEELWGFEQRYEQAIVRKFVELKFGGNPSLALAGPMEFFMAAARL